MFKKISLLLCVFSLAISANAIASPYVQLNAALSPSTTITNADTDITTKKAMSMSYGFDAILGTQGRLFAYEASVGYMKNPSFVTTESHIVDYKLSALVAPKLGLGFMAVIPYIGPQIGYSSYSTKVNNVSESNGAFLYGAKAGIKLPLALFYVDLGASYLQRRGKMFSSNDDTNITKNINAYLGVGFRLF